ncbi:MAG: NAD(+) diphosphatase [Acetobacteraceae bacterium]|nr:NAD(+) diphosphatase [Acetobacteraceae bacterium]MBV8590975.1 NAD(+) diphosphatase [Acetobacteraceae bacterium]
MPLILASRPNTYTGSPLDRAGERRDDPAWVAAALEHPDALFVPVWRSRNLIAGVDEGKPHAVYVSGATSKKLRMGGGPWAILGLYKRRPMFAMDLSEAEDPLPLLPPALGEFIDLRDVGPGLPPEEASVLAHARGLMYWRQRSRFCNNCGAPCEPTAAGHVLVCTQCNAQHFPRTDPAVIMLVVRDDRCLLGHSHRFPRAAMYSTLAGFVEPGESLEEAVRREVREETGIETGNVNYHSSQPWPFPASLMLGFYAEALTEEMKIDSSELKDARWFTREQVRNHESEGFDLPRSDSIARRLIEDWVNTE